MAKARLDQKITMVTGKGGVGKSTVAAAIALAAAQRGERVLLTEFSEPPYFARLINQPIGYPPVLWRQNLWLSAWDGVNALREFLIHYVKLEGVVSLFFDNKIMKALIQAAPALKELALLGKLTSGVRGIGPEMDFDHIVVDAFASGHFKALIDVPKGMGDLIRLGPMGEQSRDIHRVLTTAANTRIVLVTLPEELPATEAVELHADLRGRGLERVDVVCNRVLDFPITKAELADIGDRAAGVGLGDFARFTSTWRVRQERSLTLLRDAGLEVTELPFLFEAEALARVERLAQEVPWKT